MKVDTNELTLRAIAQSIPQLVWTSGPGGKCDFVNDRWSAYTGIPASRSLGNFWHECVHEEEQQSVAAAWTSVLETGLDFESECRLFHAPSDKFRWNMVRAVPVRDAAGNVEKWFCTGTDIHELKTRISAQKDAETLLQLVINSIPGVIWWKDKDSKFLGCNKKNALRAGFNDPSDLIGKTDHEMPWKDQADYFQRCDRRVMENNVAEYHIIEPIILVDGKTAWLDTSKVPLLDSDGNVVGTVGNYVDITELVKLTEQRQDFMASLAHDLKVPIIGAIRAFEVLINGLLGELSPSQADFVQKLHSSHEHLLSIIQTLLQVLRYEASADQLDLVECDLAAIGGLCLADVKTMASVKGVALTGTFTGDLSATADQTAISRMLLNLLGNAIKFTDGGGEVEMSIEEQNEPDRNSAVIKVRDNGPGINKEDQKKLFQRFWQGGGVKKYAADTGLGLYLSRQIAEGHGGHITVVSEEGHGSTFIVVLPRQGPSSKIDLRLV